MTRATGTLAGWVLVTAETAQSAAASILFCSGVVLTTKPVLLALGFTVATVAGLAYGFARRGQPSTAS